ncbi:MAG: selenide, water dikinase SelD [Flavobacteriales bacterium]
MELIKLTQFSKGGGCGCKIAPRDLEKLLGNQFAKLTDTALLVGNHTGDDAAVYDLGNGQGLISTTDFFVPIVDDPFLFGKIAAANALSDVYAMGGKPIMALAIMGWPIDKIPMEMAQEVMRGAREVCKEAEIQIAGGHSIDISQPVFGLSVNGMVDLKNLKKNSTAREGDLIYITKPLGTGILTTAEKRGILREEHKAELYAQMSKLNSIGKLFGPLDYIHAMTDITGFGLLGHLYEMCKGANQGAEITYSAVPIIKSAKEYVAQMVYADNTMRNWNAYEPFVEGISGESLFTLCDPQTNGGLMVAVDPTSQKEFETLLSKEGYADFAVPAGRFNAAGEKLIRLT